MVKKEAELIQEIIDSLNYWMKHGDEIINQEHINLMEVYLLNAD